MRMHVRFHNPRVIAYIDSLPPRRRSRMLEELLLRALEQEEWERRLAGQIAASVVEHLRETGFVATGTEDGDATVGRDVPQNIVEAVGRDVPQNAVTRFLQGWGDDE
ncbi:MAG: hypothetical protein K6T30_03160 [Alicyclobacillus sp.]|nr:hypothetical protein [Alicyclobacillus sp.]